MRYETNLETGEVTEHPDAPVTTVIPADNNTLRANAYRNESDPVFFQEQRGEVPAGTWLAKVEEIRQRYPQIG